MRRCGSCGAESPTRARFCGSCGAALAARCASCGETLEPGQRFCWSCGSAAEPAGAVHQDTVVGNGSPVEGHLAERRVCSVLFCDLVGFTTLSETRDPEEVREVLSRYFEVARQLIARYGGIVEKFIGDAVMAVWGTPTAKEGDTERAVRAALDLVAAVESLGAEVGAPQLAARAGIVTGEVAVTIGAQGEGMVAGDAVNTASRVQSVAGAGGVLVDEATKKLSEGGLAFRPEGTFELKGKERPEPLYRAVRVLGGVGGTQRGDSLEAPFIGRDVELRTLKDLFHSSAERRTPRLVVVTGAAGIGKSRLAWEFEKYADGIADTILWHRGRCLSYGEGVTFWALAEIVRQRFGIKEEDPTDTAAEKLAEGMVRFVEDEEERRYVGSRLSRLLGVPYRADANVVLSQEELFAGWRLFFERLAQVAPVILLVEDAHHADEGLLSFLSHLVDWIRDLPVFVLLFARPGLEAIDSGFGVGRNRSTLSLDPLDDASMSALVSALVPGMPEREVATIRARAQGVPLFAVETVRSLIDRGVVRREGDVYVLAGDVGELQVPETLHALLAARLDALPADVRTLVADASVLGTSFPEEALVEISGRDQATVRDALSELVRRDVLEVYADPLSPERGAYRFSQEMLRRVAYETLSKKDRKQRHLAVAGHLRAAFANDGEEIVDAIARHYLDALSYGPNDADVSEVTGEALHQLIRAAERADRSGAQKRSAESYALAAAIAPDIEAAALAERAATAYLDHGDADASIRLAEDAIARYQACGEDRSAARMRSKMGRAMAAAGRVTEGREALVAALGVLRDPPGADTVEALVHFSAHEALHGDASVARELVTEALALGQALDAGPALFARLFVVNGQLAGHENRSIEAEGYMETATRLAERSGDLGLLAFVQVNLSDSLSRLDPARAAEAASSAAAHARRTGRRQNLAIALTNLGVALMELGRWDEAAAAFTPAEEEDLVAHPVLRRFAAWLAALRGDASVAEAVVRDVAGAAFGDDPQTSAEVGIVAALGASARGDDPAALAAAMEVLEFRFELGVGQETQRWAWPLAARTARRMNDATSVQELLAMLDGYAVGHLPTILRAERAFLSALLAAEAGRADADDVVVALQSLRDAGNPYQLGHGLCDFAAAFGHHPLAEDAVAEVEGIARSLGCVPLVERAVTLGRARAFAT
jgi:class 3 adenylate cyclase/tetratricopeptide (TPR) repeat protein